MPPLRTRVRPALIGALTLLGACAAPEPPYAVTVRAAPYPPTPALAVGGVLPLLAEARATAPHAGFSPPSHTFRWRSSDSRVAEVGPGGVVRARAAGPVTITAEYGASRGSLALTVTAPLSAPLTAQ